MVTPVLSLHLLLRLAGYLYNKDVILYHLVLLLVLLVTKASIQDSMRWLQYAGKVSLMSSSKVRWSNGCYAVTQLCRYLKENDLSTRKEGEKGMAFRYFDTGEQRQQFPGLSGSSTVS